MIPTNPRLEKGSGYTGGPMRPIEQEVARGLRFAHIMVLAMQRQENETVRLIEALNNLLAAKGIIREAEWAETLETSTRIPPDFLL